MTYIEAFNATIDFWIKELEQYTFVQLTAKPAPNSWSVGQMYIHLISDARFYLQQIELCAASDEYASEEASLNAKVMFQNNAFPDEVIEGSPDNALIPQPQSKEQLLDDIVKLKSEMNAAALLISQSPFRGKSRHPGLNYFSAQEWLQFANMHFRHHLRQKKRLDEFLKSLPSH